VLKSVGGLAGGLPRHSTAVLWTSGYLGFGVPDEHQHVDNLQRVVELYEVLRPALHAYLASLGLNQEQAEDIIQQTFLRLMRHILRNGPERNLRAWLFRVARNTSVDLYRSENRWRCDIEAAVLSQGCPDPAPNPEEKVILEECKRQFESARAQLTPKQRRSILLRAEGLRYREIAVILGVSVQRVVELVQRAISSLEAGS
jgi:RNA polymerase sigma-70 factor (ECF subfamily)